MAYKKTYKRTTKKAYKKPMRYKVADAAMTALKIAKSVKRLVNVEMKACETNFPDVGIDSTGLVLSLATIPKGDDANERDGISVKPMRVSGRLYVDMNINDGSVFATLFRMIIFRGKQEHSNPYDVQGTGQYDILDPDTKACLARKNRDNRFGTKVLYDKLITLSAVGKNAQICDINIKTFGHINYDGGADGDLGLNIDDGGIYILFVSDKTGDAKPIVTGQLTVTYSDN